MKTDERIAEALELIAHLMLEDRKEKKGVKTDQDSISWGELAELTHGTQVERFGWCGCEDNEGNENPYTDCPKEG